MNTLKENYSKIHLWLLLNSVMIIVMVIIGGTTRLTDSGLSMIDWSFFKGILPPTNPSDWEFLFTEYKKFPEFKLINYDMELSEFKKIFFWEYVHRVWGRLIGLTFFIPFFYFLIKKQLSSKLLKILLVVCLLGMFQGFMGWYMVESGLQQEPNVSQYRLAAHLSIAFIIYSILLFLSWNQFCYNRSNEKYSYSRLNKQAIICYFLIFFTIILGAFVAGTDAGLAYNSFPLMGDSFFPPEAFRLEPWWKNFFENISLIQFDHRILATFTLCTILYVWFTNNNKKYNRVIRSLLNLLVLAIFLQYGLGILTLLFYVPVGLGVIHQLGSLVLLSLITLVISEIYTTKKGIL